MGKEAPVDDPKEYRSFYRGVIGVQGKMPVRDRWALSLVYTPGVGFVSSAVNRDTRTSFEYTNRANLIAIVTDGSDLLDLGNAGPEAALPIMESKSAVFKAFAGVDAIPLCVNVQEVDEIVDTCVKLVPTFGAFCLDGIASPKSFLIQQQLSLASEIPVVDSRQECLAAAILAGLLNALRLTGKRMADISVVVNGAGASAVAVAKMLVRSGANKVVFCDPAGAVHHEELDAMEPAEALMTTRVEDLQYALSGVMRGADVFIGLPGGGRLNGDMVGSMARDAIVFALAAPEPQITPEAARAAGARVVATSSSAYPNQIVEELVSPGIFRGLLGMRARRLSATMIEAAAKAAAGLVADGELSESCILPSIMNLDLAPTVAAAVAEAASSTGEARVDGDPALIARDTKRFLYEGHLPVPDRGSHGDKKLSFTEDALDLRRRYHGALEVRNKIAIKDERILNALFLTPETAHPARQILGDPSKVFELTARGNLVAVVSDGTAVLGLGDIGPEAAMPVMEGKAVLFNTFAGVEAFPICVGTKDPDEIVEVVKRIAPVFGGVNLEDISAPRCFAIERKLKQETDIPIFHDDQHGTAVIVLAGMLNALKVTGKDIGKIQITMNGAGAAALSVTNILMSVGIKNIVLCDSKGAVYQGRPEGMNWAKDEIAKVTNREMRRGSLAEVIAGSDVFIGLSAAGVLSPEMVRSMAPDPIVFAMANPIPEIMPDEAKAAGAKVVATGRSDFENQVNNSLAFPGIFRGALDTRATDINEAMKVAAAYAIASLVTEDELRPEYILPSGVDFRVAPKVAAAVAKAAMESGVARVQVDPQKVEESTLSWVYEGRLIPLS